MSVRLTCMIYVGVAAGYHGSATRSLARPALMATRPTPPPPIAEESYAEQFERLFSLEKLPVATPVAQKPTPAAQARSVGARRIPFSDVFATRAPPAWQSVHLGRAVYMGWAHACFVAAFACFFSWRNLAWHFLFYTISALGITFSFHRQLTHKSFTTPKWLEYTAAYAGTLAAQGSPTEWVSDHRYHHLHTETPLDPHSSYEGFWWSHMGWALDWRMGQRRCPRTNVADLESQPFYVHLDKNLAWHLALHLAIMYALGGLPWVVWRMAGVTIWYHVTWLVNSASHIWGSQPYRTGDQSRNNALVGLLAFGEGWHNNHHAFEYSARHGLEKGQLDITWMLIRALERIGLAKNVRLPTEDAMRRRAACDVARLDAATSDHASDGRGVR
jgi:stearoyl-CoA desaturase (delta-9 desaturase)